jgi:hypothetical protein
LTVVGTQPIRRRQLPSIGQGIALLASLLPPLVIAVVIARWGVNVPMRDHWSFAGEMLTFLSGSYDWTDLWAPFAQHRIVVPKLVMFVLADWTRWDFRAEMWFNFAIALGSLGLLGDLARRSLRPIAPAAWVWSLPWISAWVFSLAAWQSWTFGWMMNAYLAVLGASIAAWASHRYASSGRGVVLMLLGGALATLSYLSGMLLLALVPMVIAVAGDGAPRRFRHAWMAGLAAATLIGAYLVDYPAIRVARSIGLSGLEPVPAALFAVRMLGAPLALSDADAALAWGLAGIAVVVLAAASLAVARDLATRRALLPWLLLAGFAAGSAAATATGRLATSPAVALISRYALLSALLWVALPACVMTLAYAMEWRFRARWLRILAGTGLAVVLLVAGRAYLEKAVQGLVGTESRSASASIAVRCMFDVDRAPDRCLRRVSPDFPGLVRRITPYLARFGLGPFAGLVEPQPIVYRPAKPERRRRAMERAGQ